MPMGARTVASCFLPSRSRFTNFYSSGTRSNVRTNVRANVHPFRPVFCYDVDVGWVFKIPCAHHTRSLTTEYAQPPFCHSHKRQRHRHSHSHCHCHKSIEQQQQQQIFPHAAENCCSLAARATNRTATATTTTTSACADNTDAAAISLRFSVSPVLRSSALTLLPSSLTHYSSLVTQSVSVKTKIANHSLFTTEREAYLRTMKLVKGTLISPFSGLGFAQPDGFSLWRRQRKRNKLFNRYPLITSFDSVLSTQYSVLFFSPPPQA